LLPLSRNAVGEIQKLIPLDGSKCESGMRGRLRVMDRTVLDKCVEKRKVKLGEVLFEMPSRKGPRGGIHRAHFLDELVKLVPDGVSQFKKKLLDITEADDGSGMLS
jgi:hypothetical protein